MPRVNVLDIEMNYIDQGSGEPIVFLHGLGGSAQFWMPQVKSFSSSYRVIAADNRGHGLSSKPLMPYTMRLFADDWKSLLDAIGIDSAHMVGLSMGGCIAMIIALDRPDMVKSLVLVDSWAYPDERFCEFLRARESVLLNDGLEKYAEFSISAVLSEEFLKANPGAKGEYHKRIVSMNEPQALAASCRALMDFDLRGRLGGIKAPALIMVGQRDSILPPHLSEYIHKSIPGSRFMIIDGAGHLPPVEKPELFEAEVMAFLSSVGGGQPDPPGSRN